MPTYDYKCKECDHQFDVFHSMTEEARKECPACGKMSLVRLIGTGAGIIFKGGGFYETDYKRKHEKRPTTPKKQEPPCPESCPAKKECAAAKKDSSPTDS